EVDERLPEAQHATPSAVRQSAHFAGRYPRRRVRVDEHTIEFDGGPVFYRSAPATGTPTLYLHGIPTSSDDFVPFLERAGGIAPDLPGFGRSTKSGHLAYTLDFHAGFVEWLLHELGVERVSLVLHDWGAGGGLVFAQRHPERIERLVLSDALPLLSGFRWDRLGRALRTPVLGELVMGSTGRRILARRLRGGAVTPGAWPAARLATVWEHFDQGTQRAVLRMYRSAGERELQQAGAELGQLPAPAMILWGGRDTWFPSRLAHEYARRLPHAEVRLLDDAGHWPWLDEPGAIDTVAAFLGP
ncbi:MAG: alpha/beta fold hydrolase, partial [Geminicoccaceae bacterium]